MKVTRRYHVIILACPWLWTVANAWLSSSSARTEWTTRTVTCKAAGPVQSLIRATHQQSLLNLHASASENDDNYDSLENYFPEEDAGNSEDERNEPLTDVWDIRSAVQNASQELEMKKKKSRISNYKSTDSLSSQDFSKMTAALNSKGGSSGLSTVPVEQGSEVDLEEDLETSGIFLDEESYLRLSEEGGEISPDNDPVNRDLYGPNFSARQIQEFANPPNAQYPEISKDTRAKAPEELTLEDVIALRDQVQKNPPQPSSAEEDAIFQQIVLQEQAFFEQTSDIFQQGLTNVTAAKEATMRRRSARYRAAISKELERLEDSIHEIESILGEQEDPSTAERIKQDLQVQGGEVQPTRDQGDATGLMDVSDETNESHSGAWVLVDDPSTGNSFYWNDQTGEMKWDVEQ